MNFLIKIFNRKKSKVKSPALVFVTGTIMIGAPLFFRFNIKIYLFVFLLIILLSIYLSIIEIAFAAVLMLSSAAASITNPHDYLKDLKLFFIPEERFSIEEILSFKKNKKFKLKNAKVLLEYAGKFDNTIKSESKVKNIYYIFPVVDKEWKNGDEVFIAAPCYAGYDGDWCQRKWRDIEDLDLSKYTIFSYNINNYKRAMEKARDEHSLNFSDNLIFLIYHSEKLKNWYRVFFLSQYLLWFLGFIVIRKKVYDEK